MFEERWPNVSSGHPCDICGKPDWCRYSPDGHIRDCYRECGPGGTHRQDKSGTPYWRHRAASENGASSALAETEPNVNHQSIRGSAKEVDKVYRAMLNALGVYEDHAQRLHDERGLSLEEARSMGYRSFPEPRDARALVDSLIQQFGEPALLRVPGFDRPHRVVSVDSPDGETSTLDMTELVLSGSPGQLLAQFDAKGLIEGMMLRVDYPGERDGRIGSRYFPVTSRTYTGCAAKIGIHHPRRATGTALGTVRLIEGIIKANTATLRTGIYSLGIQNGSRWAEGFKAAKKLGATVVRVAPDADTKGKMGIAAALALACDEFASDGGSIEVEAWPEAAGKGLDDVLVAGRQAEVHVLTGAKAWEFLSRLLLTAGCPSNPRIDARVVLHDVVERTEEEPSAPFAENVAVALAKISPTTVEGQRLFEPLRKHLSESASKELDLKLAAIRTKDSNEERSKQLQERKEAGQRVFSIGDQAEVCKALLDDLTRVGSSGSDHELCVYDRGALYKYESNLGILQRLDEATLVTQVASYSQCPVGKKGTLKISHSFAKGTLELAYARRSKPRFFDDAPAGVAFANGFLRVDIENRTVHLVPHSREQRTRTAYDFEYRPTTAPQKFLGLLERCFGERPDYQEIVACLQEFVGSCIVGLAPRFRRAVILKGRGNDGKSTFAEVTMGAMPQGSVASTAPQNFNREYNRAALDGVRLNCIGDLPEQDIVDSGPLKAIITGDPIEARNPYGRVYMMRPIAGQMYSCNELFRVRDTSPAFRRRWVVLNFERPISASEVNEHLAAEILGAEVPSIVCWAIEGLVRRLAANEYTLPTSSVQAVDEWLGECDPINQYLQDCALVLGPEERGNRAMWTAARNVYEDYKTWARDTGHSPMSETNFGRKLKTFLGLSRGDVVRAEGTFYPLRLPALQQAVRSEASNDPSREELEAMLANAVGACGSPIEEDYDVLRDALEALN